MVAVNSDNFDGGVTIPDTEQGAAAAAVNQNEAHYLRLKGINEIGVGMENGHAVILFGVQSNTATITSQIPPMLNGIPTRIEIRKRGAGKFGVATGPNS